jgi:O-antigen ligase
VLVLLATISRTAFAAVIVGALVVLAIRWRAVRAATAAAAVLAVVLAASLLDVPPFGKSGGLTSDLLGRLGWALQFGRPALEPWDTFTWRLTLWPHVVSEMLEHPWTGQGPGTRKPYLGVPTHAHNIFLETGVDLGIPGLLLLVALLAMAVVHIARALRATWRGPHQGLAAAIGGALAAHLLWSQNDILGLGLRLGAFFWVLLAMAVCLPTSRSADPDSASEPRPAGASTADG